MMLYVTPANLIRKHRIGQIFGLIGTVLLLVLAGCEIVSDSLTPQGFSVSGTVSKSGGGAVRGAMVYLEKAGANSGVSTSTGSNGNYAIVDVAAGTYTLKVSLAGYDPVTTSPFTVNGDISGKDITLQEIEGVIHTATFDVNGGNPLDAGQGTRTVDHNVAIGALPDPTRAGYTFNGWYTLASGGVQYTDGTAVMADITLYAHWSTGTYTVTFDVNGGNVLDTGQETRTVNQDAAVGTLPVPSHTGYTFNDWYTLASGGTQYADGTAVTADITLYAHWSTGSYTVTFDVNGGNPLGADQEARTINYGAVIGSLPAPVREGYIFDGWYTLASGGTQYADGTAVTADITLYAHWSTGTYTVTVSFNVNGGSALDTGQETRTVNHDAAIGVLPAPVREGYIFAGWYTLSSGGDQYTDGTAVTADITLYAHWSTGTYTVTVSFNVNGGSALSAGQETRTVNHDAAIGVLPVPARTGYTFTGWYTLASGGVQYTDGTAVTADITLYARWTIISYTVTFNVNGGNALGAGQGSRSVNYGAAIGTLPVPTRAGYTFSGWYTLASGGVQYTDTLIITADLALYAHWTIISYTVSFNVNGGNALGVGQETRAVNYGAAIGTLPAPTRAGHVFSGWYTLASGGVQYTDGTIVTADITLYARWTIISYTVTFNVNGGNALGMGQETRAVNYGAAIGTLPVPTRAGHVFSGWYTLASGGVQYTDGTAVTADITLYARWSAITVTAPDAPTVTAGNNQLTVSWAAVSGATAYEVWRGTSNNSSSSAKYGGDVSGSSTTITGLTNGTTYYIWIKAKNGVNTSGFSPVASGIPAEWIVSTLAGSGTAGYADRSNTEAQFNYPRGVAVDDAGNVYVADPENHRIRKIDPNGMVSTLAGSGTAGYLDRSNTEAQFNYPRGVAVDSTGNVYVADTDNHRIRKIAPNGMVSTLAGSGTAGYADGRTSTTVQFSYPLDVAVNSAGNVYVADSSNHCIRIITPGVAVTTLAGGPAKQGYADGSSGVAKFSFPQGVAVDDSTGNVYVADGFNRIRKIASDRNRTVTTFAGSGTAGHADGTGTAAQFTRPYGVAVDSTGNVYVADTGNHRIRRITPNGVVTTLAGSGTASYADGALTAAQFSSPGGVAVDSAGNNLYIADSSNHRIRKMTR
jgi:uncharacterized repeat protein (TIGR02543 family)